MIMINYFAVFLGGGFGSLCRYLLSTSITKYANTFYPVGTLSVNLIGSFLIGVLFELFERFIVSQEIRTLLTIGFLGGFTTFSTFALENANMFRSGHFKYFIINLFTHNLAGIFCVFLGMLFVRISIKVLTR